jgi:hypothetical protein
MSNGAHSLQAGKAETCPSYIRIEKKPQMLLFQLVIIQIELRQQIRLVSPRGKNVEYSFN